MTRAIIIAALALSGCQLALPKLPTPADLCKPGLRGAFMQATGSTAEEVALACAVAG